MIRSLTFADAGEMKALHGMQGFDYPLPSLSVFVVKRGYESEDKVRCAILARPTVELYMLADPEWASPAMRLEVLRELHEDVRKQLHANGYESAVIWIPPEKEKSFSRRLKRCFGWVPVRWKCMARLTNA